MESMPVDRRKEVWSQEGLFQLVPDKQLDEIYWKYSTEEQRLLACADFYVNSNPDSSWTHLCERLYSKGEVTAARKAKTFIPQTGEQSTYMSCNSHPERQQILSHVILSVHMHMDCT